jgi:hypothetical protein
MLMLTAIYHSCRWCSVSNNSQKRGIEPATDLQVLHDNSQTSV